MDQCAAIAEVQVKQAFGDLSSVCTATFASQVGGRSSSHSQLLGNIIPILIFALSA